MLTTKTKCFCILLSYTLFQNIRIHCIIAEKMNTNMQVRYKFTLLAKSWELLSSYEQMTENGIG